MPSATNNKRGRGVVSLVRSRVVVRQDRATIRTGPNAVGAGPDRNLDGRGHYHHIRRFSRSRSRSLSRSRSRSRSRSADSVSSSGSSTTTISSSSEDSSSDDDDDGNNSDASSVVRSPWNTRSPFQLNEESLKILFFNREPKKIIDFRFLNNGKIMYRMKWKNSHDTSVSVDSLLLHLFYPNLVMKYFKRRMRFDEDGKFIHLNY